MMYRELWCHVERHPEALALLQVCMWKKRGVGLWGQLPDDLFWQQIAKRVVLFLLRHRHWHIPASVGLQVLRDTIRREDAVEETYQGHVGGTLLLADLDVRTSTNRSVSVGLDYFLFGLTVDPVAVGLGAIANFGMPGERNVSIPFLDEHFMHLPPSSVRWTKNAKVSCADVMRMVDFLKAHLENDLFFAVEPLLLRLRAAAKTGQSVDVLSKWGVERGYGVMKYNDLVPETVDIHTFVLLHGSARTLFVLYVHSLHVEAFLPLTPLVWDADFVHEWCGSDLSACTPSMLEELCESCYDHAVLAMNEI